MTIDGTPMPLVGVTFVVTPHLSLPNAYLIMKHTLNFSYIGQISDSGDYLVIFSSLLFCIGYVVLEADWDRP